MNEILGLDHPLTRTCNALDVVASGLERLPFTVIQRQRRRLASPRTRRRLARTLDSMVDETVHSRPLARSGRPFLCRRTIVAAQDVIRAVAALLGSDGVSVCGVALCERLITIGRSPLYGSNPAALRDELRRARFVLAGD